ncbi:MAG: DUF3095 domain-containing protein [Parvibaculaceae bacterium]
MDASTGIGFYRAIMPFDRFSGVVVPENYHALPEDWIIGVADVVDSTGAIAEGRYKAVNMVGASVISALRNALGERDFPFVFGGDGASFALPGAHRWVAAQCLAAVQVWAAEEMGLKLRGALVPLAVIRAADYDVLVGRYAPSPHIAYAMFAGGGVAWAEKEMKAGRFHVPAAAPGTRPDLDGLSCRWSPMRSERGIILSVLVLPEGEPGEPFRALVEEVLALSREEASEGRPLSETNMRFAPGGPGVDLATRVPAGPDRAVKPRWRLLLEGWLGWVVLAARIPIGGFRPKHYLTALRANSDFRKFDDGLKLTLDCSQRLADRLEGMLVKARDAGVCRYGLHRQEEAIMTCIVPSVMADDHIHFIDGAAGGYAEAARMLKLAVEPRLS